MKKIFLFFLSIAIFFFTKKTVFASLVINEVYPNPHTDEKEWIEIFNNSQESENLFGWTLMDKLVSPSIIYKFESDSTDTLSIEPLSFLVIELKNNKLNNSKDGVTLINTNNEIASQLNYTNSKLGMSFSLFPNGNQVNSEAILSTPSKGTTNITVNSTNDQNSSNEDQSSDEQSNSNNSSNNDSNENQSSNEQYDSGQSNDITSNNEQPENQSENNKTENSTDNKQQYPNLFIFEIMACPNHDKSEWIKIKNPNNFPVTLDKWKIKDKANNQVNIPTKTIITEFEFTTITLTNNILNNSGDNIFLFNPNNDLVSQFNYDQCTTGFPQSINSTTDNPTIKKQDNKTTIANNNQKTKKIQSTKLTKNKKIIALTLKSKIAKLRQINSFLKKTNSTKLSTSKKDNYISKQIVMNHKSLPKIAIISVIIGGMLVTSSQLIFYKWYEKN